MILAEFRREIHDRVCNELRKCSFLDRVNSGKSVIVLEFVY